MKFSIALALLSLFTCGRPIEARNNGEWDDGNVPYEIKQWFHSRKIQACCSEADGKTTDYDIRGDGYYVPDPFAATGTWRRVPDETIVKGVGNPTGHGMIWYTPTHEIRCFVPLADA